MKIRSLCLISLATVALACVVTFAAMAEVDKWDWEWLESVDGANVAWALGDWPVWAGISPSWIALVFLPESWAWPERVVWISDGEREILLLWNPEETTLWNSWKHVLARQSDVASLFHVCGFAYANTRTRLMATSCEARWNSWPKWREPWRPSTC